MADRRTRTDPHRAEDESALVARRCSLTLLVGLALFVLAALPVCADLARYHGDERFYTDAALRMEASGDWFTPRYSDGSERWNKPLATYWLIGASFRVFGPGPLAARLPFLLAGALVLALTARTARVLFRDPRAALFAAFVLGSSAEFLQLVTRSTPDVLVTAGIAASLAGAAELAFVERPGRSAKWLFFGGAGLAVIAKGALGLVAPLFGLAWILARHGRRHTARQLHPGAVSLFVLCLLAAALPPLLRAGEQGLGHTLDDQIGTRTAQSAWMALGNFAAYATNVVRHFLPWSALALGALVFATARAREWARGRGAQLAFALGWYAVLLVVFSLGNIQRGRYLLPAYPLVCAALGAFLIATLATGRGERVLRGVALALTGLALCGAGALAWAGWRVGETSAEAMLALAAAAVGMSLVVRVERVFAAPIAALVLCVALPLGERALHRVFDSAPAADLAVRLEALGARGDDIVCIGGETSLASQLRLVSAARLDPRSSPTLAAADLGSARWLVLAPDAVRAFTPESARALAVAHAEDCGFEYPRWHAEDVRTVLASAAPRSAWLARRDPYRIVELAPAAPGGRGSR